MTIDEMDDIDSTGIDFEADPVSDDEVPFVALSPDGDPARIEEYGRYFGGGN